VPAALASPPCSDKSLVGHTKYGECDAFEVPYLTAKASSESEGPFCTAEALQSADLVFSRLEETEALHLQVRHLQRNCRQRGQEGAFVLQLQRHRPAGQPRGSPLASIATTVPNEGFRVVKLVSLGYHQIQSAHVVWRCSSDGNVETSTVLAGAKCHHVRIRSVWKAT